MLQANIAAPYPYLLINTNPMNFFQSSPNYNDLNNVTTVLTKITTSRALFNCITTWVEHIKNNNQNIFNDKYISTLLKLIDRATVVQSNIDKGIFDIVRSECMDREMFNFLECINSCYTGAQVLETAKQKGQALGARELAHRAYCKIFKGHTFRDEVEYAEKTLDGHLNTLAYYIKKSTPSNVSKERIIGFVALLESFIPEIKVMVTQHALKANIYSLYDDYALSEAIYYLMTKRVVDNSVLDKVSSLLKPTHIQLINLISEEMAANPMAQDEVYQSALLAEQITKACDRFVIET